MKNRSIVIVTGPTGVGKTDFIEKLAEQSPIEVINGDMGQMYVPLTIGTAKPDWQNASVSHHLFDILNHPTYFSAMKYREKVRTLVEDIWKREKMPVIVGGSSFYLLSLFFPVPDCSVEDTSAHQKIYEGWDHLKRIDPKRAKAINPHDTYRIQRAIAIWHATGKKPSHYTPSFDPIASHIVLVWLERDRKELYDRINKRVESMLREGWLEEANHLTNTAWESFLKKKKIIGYDILFAYQDGRLSRNEMQANISKKTRHYAKRQLTFWRSFKKKLANAPIKASSHRLVIHEWDLTQRDIESYIKQLKNDVLS